MRASTSLILTLVLCSAAASARAQAPILTGLGGPEGYGTSCLHPNDDGSSVAIDLTAAFPSGLRFFTRTHTTAYVNTNGNITFSGPLRTYTPNPFPVADQPMIAPYWADVDIRPEGDCSTGTRGTCESPSDNGVWWHLEPGRMVVTWDRVGYYRCREDRRMTFQLILTAVPSCGGGATDFDVEYRFNTCEWETGEASGGTDGFGGTEAQVGFDAGNGSDFVMLPGSREPGIAERMCTESNVGEPGVWRFEIRSGTVVCPDAGEPCDTGMVGVCGEGVTQCVGTGTVCQPVVPAGDETCDALDNDCDGAVDEGSDLCALSTSVCDRGVCIETCFEGGCPPGQTCTDEGRCVDEGCEDVECPAGQRCAMGACGDACDSVVCPAGQSCRGGRCLDLCADIECDPECTACVDGECVPRCDLEGVSCAPGESCTAEGICEPTECLGVECDPGFVCTPGEGCVDACEGVVCPSGEECREGECRRPAPTPPPADAGPVTPMDAGSTPGADGGPGSGLIDGEPPGRRESTECICAAPGSSRTPAPWAGLVVLGLAVAWRRRRQPLGATPATAATERPSDRAPV
jgi:MYXO-CTERM domain-containing protein